MRITKDRSISDARSPNRSSSIFAQQWLRLLTCISAILFAAAGCGGDGGVDYDTAQATLLPDTGTVMADKVCPPDSMHPTSVRASEAPTDWRSFRVSHPYHVQEIAVGSKRRDGSRIIVIAEPPPRVCLADIQTLAAGLARAQTHRWRMGFDGWVQDVVVRVPAMDSLEFDLMLLRLNRLLFGTNYEARVVALGSNERSAERPRLDFRVTAAELRDWLLGDSETFTTLGDVAGLSLKALLAKGAHGEFFSTRPGFVLWIIPRAQDVSKYLSVAQSWANDADLILGAVADDQTVAVVGRERQVSKAILPPLRMETINTVAGSGTDHLAQSYERTYLYSGRFDRRNDWAPIYLSPVLIDDEYGSLLNITDQLLKSWSEHGTVRYINFPYPSPDRYPFDVPLHERLKAARVTFNWNTRGAGYVSEEEGYRVYALNRTGALPVSYFAGEEQTKNEETGAAEEIAYDYFASLNDPNLARVVQYAALYQLFREFNVVVPKTVEIQSDPHDALVDQTERMLQLLASFPIEKYVTADDPDSTIAIIAAGAAAVKAIRSVSVGEGVRVLAERVTAGRPSDRQQSADELLYMRAFVNDTTLRSTLSSEDQIAALALRDQRTVQRALQATLDVILPSGITRARETYISASSRPAGTWIRTASIVQSTSAELDWVGGHNLDAAVTRVRASAGVAKGEVKVVTENGRTVILANEADVPRLSSNVREIAGLADETNGGARITERLASLRELPVRPRLEVIPPTSRLASSGTTMHRSFLGFERVHRGLSSGEVSAAGIMKASGRKYAAVERFDNGAFEIVLGDPPRRVRAGNTASAIDFVVAQGKTETGSLQLQLTGFREADAKAFTRNVEHEYRRGGHSQDEVRAAVRDATQEPTQAARLLTVERDFSKARVKHIERVEFTEGSVTKVAYKAEIEVPAVAAGEAPLVVRIMISIRDAVGVSMEAVQAAIENIMASLHGVMTSDAAARVIRRELQRAFGDAVEITTQAGDILIVQLLRFAEGTSGSG